MYRPGKVTKLCAEKFLRAICKGNNVRGKRSDREQKQLIAKITIFVLQFRVKAKIAPLRCVSNIILEVVYNVMWHSSSSFISLGGSKRLLESDVFLWFTIEIDHIMWLVHTFIKIWELWVRKKSLLSLGFFWLGSVSIYSTAFISFSIAF